MPVRTEQIVNRFGLEVSDGLVWQGGWQPGGEYTKNIKLRNIDIKTKKLKYRIPCSRFFTTKKSKQIVLSSGTTIKLPITFKPLDQNVYEEDIIFETQNGNFSIPIKAVLPEADLWLPDAVDFGACAVGDQMQKEFEIINYCDLEVSFHLNSVQPFAISPNTGFLMPKSKCKITVEYKPEAAHVYQVDATCSFATTSSKTSVRKISLLGIGKFAYLGARYGKLRGRNIDIDFGSSDLHTETTRTVELVNYSPVNAPFQVLQPSFDASLDKVFRCSLYHGVVPANGSTKLNISYTPNIRDIPQADSFEILALGATTCAVIKCIGEGKGPCVSLDASSVSFGQAETGESVTRSFKISNNSRMPAIFQFLIDCNHSCFHFDVKCGELAKNSSRAIKVTFQPEKPINYFRRVTCLIHNQDPLFVDLFGTGHSQQISPALMNKQHLDRFKVHVARGLSRLPPEDLSTLLRDKKVRIDSDNCLEVVDEALSYDLEKPNVNFKPMEEHFSDGGDEEMSSSTPHVSVDIEHIEFSRCNHGQVYHKTINVTNHTRGKVTCVWNSGVRNSPFSVLPAELDILPLKSASFSVKFKPTVQGQFFAVELEGYVSYKNMRDHRLFEDITFCPPWCVTVAVSGHTFLHRNETFLPEYQIDTSSLVFPPAVSNESTYRTLLLTNIGKNPIDFSLQSEEERNLSCKPSRGLLRDKYQIIALRFTSEYSGTHTKKLTCKLNASDMFCKEINLTGSAEAPELHIQPQETEYFKQTCVGTTSKIHIKIKNPCRIPLRFEWQISQEDKSFLSVEPSSGFISPNELQMHKWLFTPGSVSKYLFKVKIKAWIDGHPEVHSKQMFRFIGEGEIGSISCFPKALDFGDVVVGNSMQRTIKLHNESDCGLYFDLFVHHKSNEAVDDSNNGKTSLDVELSESHGYLPARSQKPVNIKLVPEERRRHQCEIICQLIPTDTQERSMKDGQDSSSLCSVSVQGVYPTLCVGDIRGTGCAQGYSMTRLWDLFSIDRFNMYLDADPGTEELLYTVATRHSTRRRMPVHTRAVMDFNFGSAPHLSDHCQITINLKNTGSANAEWTFLLPTDLQLELEFWAQTGNFDEDELHEMFVMDNSLFSIEPKKGTLVSGESQIITLTYSHSSVGIHKLPVLFKVTKGREVLLNFIGHTASPTDRYLHFSTTRHMFAPLPIGNITPPIQMYPLYNDGGEPVQFHLDLEPLQDIQQKNCGWRVFECLHPSGEIGPGECAHISWIFSPLEAKTYTVDVLIHIIGGESVLVTFTGIGYDPAIMGPTMVLSDQANDSLPHKQLIPIADQFLYLSEERISFDNVPILASANRIIFLRNISKYALSFRWILDNSPACEVISIVPSEGYIQPSECMMCKIRFYSNGPPAIYDLDCICEITNETLMSRYNKQLLEWHSRQEEKKMLFTLTEADIEPKNPNRPGSGPHKLKSIQNSSKAYMSESDLRKYEALPPINSDKKGCSEADVSETDPQPQPPDCFTVHLGITARTYTIPEFYSNFIDSVGTYFIQRDSSSTEAMMEKKRKDREECTKEEFDLISTTLPTLLKDLIQDKDFEETIKKVQEEPVPYFGMLADENFINEAEERNNLEALKHSDASVQDPAKIQNAIYSEGPTAFDEFIARSQKEELNETPFDESVSRVQLDRIIEEEPGEESSQESETRQEDSALKERQLLKSSNEMHKVLDEIFENTIFNLLSEASNEEISLTARPRLVALPPSAKGNRKSPSIN